MRAQQALENAPPDIVDREREQEGERSSTLMPPWMITLTIVAVATFIALTVVIANRAVR